jgi:hypothetical protein
MKRAVPNLSVLASVKTRGRWLFAMAASSVFLAATWVLAAHGDFHEYPSVPSSTFDLPVHELTAK